MFTNLQPQTSPAGQSKAAFYRDINLQLGGLLRGERDWVANAANLSALLYLMLADLNWAGFYILRHQGETSELVLGPFQGKPACVRIPVAPEPKGVCGAAASEKRTVIVDDVHQFPGHIACDSASNSEVVVPLLRANRVIGVLDLDSPKLARFGEDDARGLETLARLFLESTNTGD